MNAQLEEPQCTCLWPQYNRGHSDSCGIAKAEEHVKEIRRQAHRLAAEAIQSGLNMWELDRYQKDEADQDLLAFELRTLAVALKKKGGQR